MSTPPSSPVAGPAEATRTGWLAPAIIGSALLMQTLNATVLTNALPTMARALEVDPLRLNLAITMYMLSSAVFLPISGWAADRFGARRVFLAAIVLYAVASAACGLAVSLSTLVAARIAQGAAGALMGPVGRLVLLRTRPKSDLVGAMSILTMPALLGPVIGPVLGGAIVTFADWRWIFLINLPIAAVGFFLVLRHVPQVAEQDVAPIDWPGVALTGLGLAALIFGFENLGRDALPPLLVAGLFATGLGLLWAYVRYARGNPHAVLDTSLFRVDTFRASVVGGGFMRLAMGANPFLLALLFQVALGMNALQAGLLTFASAAGALVMKTVAPPILRRYGFRRVLTVNALIVGVSFMACAGFTASTPHLAIIAILLVGGFFRSLQFTSLNGLAYADIGADRMSRASTLSSMAQQLVQSIGIGLAATLLHFSMQANGTPDLTVGVVAPIFLVVGAVTFISLAFFLRLPKDAGDEMNGRA
jgi:EmrB/QacA subfamily drug resistance transporter